jgi:hypothetical protein
MMHKHHHLSQVINFGYSQHPSAIRGEYQFEILLQKLLSLISVIANILC